MIRAWLLVLLLSTGCATLPTLRLGVPYLVIWSYGDIGGEPSAFREIVIIDEIGRGGWVYGHAPGDRRRWAFQLNRASAITPLTVPPAPHVETFRSAK